MPENVTRPASNEDPDLVSGEIVGIEDRRIRVRLDSGGDGLAAAPEHAPPTGIQVGHRATFRVVASSVGGSPSLAFVESQDVLTPEEPFDREVVRLHNALANHHPTNSVRSVERVHLGEEQIHQWIGRVESRLKRLRENRAKRLDEEFYNDS